MNDHPSSAFLSDLSSTNLVLMGSPITTLFWILGICNFLLYTSSQSISLNHGCSFTDSASLTNPSRFYGFCDRSFLIRSRKFSGVPLGNLMMAARTFWYSSARVSAQKGGRPTQSSQSTIPYSYQSAILLWPLRLMISRGRQAGVPQKLLFMSSMLSVFLDSPKSVNRAWPSESRTMFSGFKSRQMIFSLCRAYRASSISAAYFLTVTSSNFLFFSRDLPKSPPSQQSITRNRQFQFWKAKCRPTMKGCLIKLSTYFYVWMYLRRLVPSTLCFLIALRAYSFSDLPFFTMYTSPNAPSPIFLQNLNASMLIFQDDFFSFNSWYIFTMFYLFPSGFLFELLLDWLCSDYLFLVGDTLLGSVTLDVLLKFWFTFMRSFSICLLLRRLAKKPGLLSVPSSAMNSRWMSALWFISLACRPMLFRISSLMPFWLSRTPTTSLWPSSTAQCSAVKPSSS